MNVLVAAPCPTSRLGIVSITSMLGICHFAEVSTEADLHTAVALSYDLVILDPAIGNISPVEIIQLLRAKAPRVNILVVTDLAEELYGVASFKSGAIGYLSKRCTAEELLNAVKLAAVGRPYVSEKIAECLVQRPSSETNEEGIKRLTGREMDIFSLLVCGKRVCDMAALLNLSVKTVSTHKANVLTKLKCDNIATLVRYAIAQGLTENCRLHLDRLNSQARFSL